MAVPTGYFYKDGAYWNIDGSGPYGISAGGVAIPLFSGPLPVASWAAKPAAAAAGVGTVISVTGVGFGGRSLWISDGTNWHPLNGHALLYSASALAAAPLATLNGAGTNQVFAGVNLLIPAGMLFDGCHIVTHARIVRTAVAGAPVAVTVQTLLGTDNGVYGGGNSFVQVSCSAAVGHTVGIDGEASFGASATSYQARGTGGWQISNTGPFERTALINTAADMYIQFAILSAAIVGDVFKLLEYRVEIRG